MTWIEYENCIRSAAGSNPQLAQQVCAIDQQLYQISGREQSATIGIHFHRIADCIRSAAGSNPQPESTRYLKGGNCIRSAAGSNPQPFSANLILSVNCIRSAAGSNPQLVFAVLPNSQYCIRSAAGSNPQPWQVRRGTDINCIRSAAGSNPQLKHGQQINKKIVSDQRPGAIRNQTIGPVGRVPLYQISGREQSATENDQLCYDHYCIRSAAGSNPQQYGLASGRTHNCIRSAAGSNPQLPGSVPGVSPYCIRSAAGSNPQRS